MLKITLVRSLIGRPDSQRKTVRSLGLRKLHSFSILPDSPSIRGQIHKVAHLLHVEDYKEAHADEIARS
ncbi:MAG: 50S ribosomal protein L30 [Quinella sp. 3Q1]|nr:50S ribosomal protein L30 [Quinella sp. 3Q1]MBR6888840.1 50S ribosomal protein L30 [Selenomonadaceae bacterium]